ncbi:ATP-binding protein [[Mycoplasma] testudinis]|uniref:ATP-binding protein n=1 Tax=[Mycoplasma] testudinis TaxID=33924 RepID=UPI001B80457C|nr:DUF4143 domain-containing protein [[Mycoplasma] testudinis]
MSLFQSNNSNGSVSLFNLFNGSKNVKGTSKTTLKELAFWICRRGWPGSLNKQENTVLLQMKNYLKSIINSDLKIVDNVNRNSSWGESILKSYARFIGSQTKTTKILKDIEENNSFTIFLSTLNSYLEVFKNSYVFEDVSTWNPNLRFKTAIQTSPTRYFCDLSIAVAALGAGPSDLIQDLKTMGFFENLCIRDLRTYVQSLDGDLYHYRDRYGLECDAIIHLRNGKYGLIKIKIGDPDEIDQAAKNMKKLVNNLNTEKMQNPSFMMVLVGIGSYAYRQEDNVLVVPISCLIN